MYADTTGERVKKAAILANNLESYDLTAVMLAAICLHDGILSKSIICGSPDDKTWIYPMKHDQAHRKRAIENLQINLGKYFSQPEHKDVEALIANFLQMSVLQSTGEDVKAHLSLNRFTEDMKEACPDFGPYNLEISSAERRPIKSIADWAAQEYLTIPSI